MKIQRVFHVLVMVALIGLSWTTAAQAEESHSGSVSYVTLSSESLQLADGRTVLRNHTKGTVLAENTAAAIHMSSQDCFGTLVMSAEGTPPKPGYGYCDGVDRDGDLWSIWWKNETGAGSTWGFLGGTGKYSGVEGGGTTKHLMQSPDGRLVISWQGKWTLKK